MKINFDAVTISLAGGRTLELDDARYSRVSCRSGTLWITQEHDAADIVLAPGQAFTVTRGGRTLVHALKPAELVLEPPQPTARVERSPAWPFATRHCACAEEGRP